MDKVKSFDIDFDVLILQFTSMHHDVKISIEEIIFDGDINRDYFLDVMSREV